jgi:hypothetical protein
MATERRIAFAELKGKVFNSINIGDDEIIFTTTDETFRMYHEQDCCEQVYIESVVGDVNELQICARKPNASALG